jgi:A1 cistron-splicing factor AAR2
MSSGDEDIVAGNVLKRRSSMGTEDAFETVPNNESPDQPATTVNLGGSDPTFVQNQISLQRNPSTAKSYTSSISRQLSLHSNSSYDASLNQSGILTVLEYSDAQNKHVLDDSPGGVTEGIRNCTLTKSTSRSTMKSSRSVDSVIALGTHPLGTLRVHSDDLENGNLAPECLLSGDVVVVTSMPTNSIFGIDTVAFSLGKDAHFEGIRELPSGAHFIYGGSSSELSTRNGFWIMSKQRATGERGEIFVKRWDSYHETLEDEVSLAEIRIQKDSVPHIFERLMPYPTRAIVTETLGDTSKQTNAPSGTGTSARISREPQSAKDIGIKDPKMWNRLTFAIKGAMLTRLTGHQWNKWRVSSTDESKAMEWKATDAQSSTVDSLIDHRAEQMAGKDLVLTFVFPRTGVTYSKDVIGRARTEQALDTSAHIIAVISDRCTYEDPDEVIGELQFCYVTGVLLGNITCQEQWAHIVKIIFKAFRLAMDMPVFFRKLIETIHAQLIYDEEGIEGSIFDHDVYLQNELKYILTVFKSRLNEQLLARGAALTYDQSSVGKAFEALESWLWKWDWDLRGNYLRSGKLQLEDGEIVDADLKDFEAEDERGEYAPVVVDLEEDGREKGLIRW